eukprot:scaffold1323_cov82-Skeletonema_dohrnii-CCMP3373.AAC.3
MPFVRLSVDLDGKRAALEPLLVGLLSPTMSSDGKLSLTSSSDDALECLLKLSLLSSMLSAWRNDALIMMLAEGLSMDANNSRMTFDSSFGVYLGESLCTNAFRTSLYDGLLRQYNRDKG